MGVRQNWQRLYVHVLEPDQTGAWAARQQQRLGGLAPPPSSRQKAAQQDAETKAQLAKMERQVAELGKLVRAQQRAQQQLQQQLQLQLPAVVDMMTQLMKQRLETSPSGPSELSSWPSSDSAQMTQYYQQALQQQKLQLPRQTLSGQVSRQPSNEDDSGLAQQPDPPKQ
jgi:hypothetical protein